MNDAGVPCGGGRGDIESQTSIRFMVDSFYKLVRQDELIGPIFEEKVGDWDAHLPTMYQFWERLLFGTGDYNGNPFQKHVNLPVESAHFTRWIKLFIQIVDENFIGLKAEEAKRFARNVAGTFQLKMGITPENFDFESSQYYRGQPGSRNS